MRDIDATNNGHHESTHPADRPAEPEHPMFLEGGMVPGDVAFMARCMIEEMLQVGLTFDELDSMSRDPNYQALYAARETLGEETFDEILESTFRRVGAFRFKTHEHAGDVQPTTLTVGDSGRND